MGNKIVHRYNFVSRLFKRYRRFFRLSYLSRLSVILLVIGLEALAIHLYNVNRSFIQNLNLASLTEAYFPAWEYSLTHRSLYTQREAATKDTTESVPVLVYHGIVAKQDNTSSTISKFRQEMFALKSAGWQTISMDDYIAFVKGAKLLPAKSFLLTFDDGRTDSFYNADPILNALGYKATMFVIDEHALNTGQSKYYLSKEEIQKMIATGRWTIEAHSYYGHDLIKISKSGQLGDFYSNFKWLDSAGRLENEQEFETRVTNDLEQSKDTLEKNFHIQVKAFAYPFGDYGQEISNNPNVANFLTTQVAKMYDVAFAQEGMHNNTEQNYFSDGGQKSTRLEPSVSWSSETLLKMLSQGSAKSLPFRASFSTNDGWMSTEGIYTLTENQSMILSTNNGSNVSGVLLDGSQEWGNYVYATNISWTHAQSVSLLVRYINAQNYLDCTYDGTYVSARENIGGNSKTISDTRYYFVKGNISLASQVQGNEITCMVNGSRVLSATIPNAPTRGMIGISIWDPTVGEAQVSVTHVEVDNSI